MGELNIHYVWVTLLVPGGGERLAGKLVAKGFCVEPSARDKSLEFSNTGCMGSVASLQITNTKFKPENEKTISQQMNGLIRETLEELAILYHSVISCNYGSSSSLSWCSSNIKSTIESGRKPICKKRPMKRYDDMTTEEKRQLDDMLVVEVLNKINQSDDDKRLPTDDMQRQYDELERDAGGMFCGCASCMPTLRDMLKKHHELTEYVLSRANSLKHTIVIPDPNDMIIKLVS